MSKYKVGDSVFKDNDSADFLGIYVRNLSDFTCDGDELVEFKKSLLKSGPSEIATSKFKELDIIQLYGYRKVCSESLKMGEEMTSQEQILTKSFDDLHWINVDMKRYTFKDVEKPVDPIKLRTKKRNRPS